MEASGTPVPPRIPSQITAEEVRRASFPQVLRGYDRDAVHDLLDRVAERLEGSSEGADAGASPAIRAELAMVGERTAGILTAAEEAAQSLREDSARYVEKLRAEAEEEVRAERLNASQRTDEMIADAESKAQRIIDDALARRRELNLAISSLVERRDEIAAEAAKLAEALLDAVDEIRTPAPHEISDSDAAGLAGGPETRDGEDAQDEEVSSEATQAFEAQPGETADPEPEGHSEETPILTRDSAETPIFSRDAEETPTFSADSEETPILTEDSEETQIFAEDESEEVDLDDDSGETAQFESQNPEAPRSSRLLVDPDEDDGDQPPPRYFR